MTAKNMAPAFLPGTEPDSSLQEPSLHAIEAKRLFDNQVVEYAPTALVTASEVAKKLRLDVNTIYRWAKKGYFKRLGKGGSTRFIWGEVWAWYSNGG